jgi:type I restriction enzyme, S subunit
MKSNWELKKLEEICENLDSKRIPITQKDRNEGKYPYYGASGIVDYVDNFIFDENLLLVSEDGANLLARTYPIAFSVSGKVWVNNHAHVLKFDKIDTQRFIEYYLNSIKLDNYVGGMAQPKLNQKSLNSIVVPLPPLPEQQRLVTILDEAFAAIAKAKENTEKNLQNARELFESYLLDVFANPGNDWEPKKLGDVCEISSMFVDPRRKDYLDLPHVRGANIASKTGKLIEIKTAREEGLISGKFAFDETMVLYSKIRPYLMKVARPDFKGLCSADIYPLSTKPGQIDRDYLFHLLLSPKFTEYAIAGSARAGMPKVNRDHLFAFCIPLPPVTTQKQLVAKIDVLHEETQRLEVIYQQKLLVLDELKKSILQKAFSGELTAPQFIQQEMVWV